MKILGLALIAGLLAGGYSTSQSPNPSEPIDVLVSKKSWRRVVRNPALDADPFRANDEQAELERDRKDNAIRNNVRVREGGTPQQTVRRAQPVSGGELQGPYTRYTYSATLKNIGTKRISSITWDYLFIDPGTGEELGRHQFTHRIKIRPGKSAQVTGTSKSPPSRVVRATQTETGLVNLEEKVILKRIEYDDGSVWETPKETNPR